MVSEPSREARAPVPQVIARHRDFAIARWDRVNLMVWRRQVTVDGLLAAEANHDAIARVHGKVIALSLIGDVLALPDTAARHHSARFMQSNASTQLCAAVIIEGESFLSMTARGIGKTLQLLSRVGFPFDVFATPRDAALWCSRKFAAQPGWDQGLVHAIDACKQQLLSGEDMPHDEPEEPADPHDRPTRP